MLEIKEKIKSYCKKPLPQENKRKALKATVELMYLLTFFALFALLTFCLGATKQNLLSQVVLTLVFSAISFIAVSCISLKFLKKMLSNVYPEIQSEAKDLLLQIVNNPKAFKLFNTKELKDDLKILIDFTAKERLDLEDILTIKQLLKEALEAFEEESEERDLVDQEESAREILLNPFIDDKNKKILMQHLDLCDDSKTGGEKEKTLYALK